MLDEGASKRNVRGKKAVTVTVAVVFLSLLVVPALYYFVIPRSEITVTTMYHEISGTGSVGMITVALRVENTGTLDAEDMTVSVVVVNGTYSGKASENITGMRLSSMEKKDISLTFAGSHYKDYHITICISYSSGGERKADTITHTVIENEHPEMNIEWKDTV